MVEITNVYAGYGGKPVISIPYLSFKAGEITSIIGRNGSGKSTLLKAIDSLIQYTGSITADGMEIAGLSHKERARTVAYLPQTLIPVRLSIRVLVSHGRYAHTGISHRLSSKDRAMVDNAMELADVYTMQDRWINEISGGEVKRSYLAMVIAQNSRYILLDEPVSNSGRLKSLIAEAGEDYPITLDIQIRKDVDRELYGKENVISSDSIVLDHCKSWLNFGAECLEKHRGHVLQVWG